MRQHILLIDDDHDEFDFLRLVVKEFQEMTCSYAHSGKMGIDLLKKGVADVVLLDINMPGMNGFEFIEALIEEDLLYGIPIYIYSNSVSHPLSQKAVELGANGLIKKPNTIGGLREIIRKIFVDKMPL